MQLPKVNLLFLTIIGCSLFLNSFAQSGQVLRIKSSNCAYNTKGETTNFATGFVYKENGRVVGIITALHAVCGCGSISAEDNTGADYFSLKIIKADIGNDIALLSSNEILKSFPNGLEFSTLDPSVLGNQKISMLAYPYGIEVNIDTKMARIRENPSPIVRLKKFIKPNIETSLRQRGSPNINKDVLNLELEITPGCSGAPILYGGKVIGVANGGLDEGRTHVCWAIPTKNIQLSSVNSLEPGYSNLGKLNPNKLFVLTCDIVKNEPNEITLNACRATESINVCNDCNGGVYSKDGGCIILNNHPTGKPQYNKVVFNFDLPEDGNCELYVQYAAARSRPLKITMNGETITETGCNKVTGGWDSNSLIWDKINFVAGKKGTNILILERGAEFPHIRAVKLKLP